jgi:hypothetical protein
MDTARMTIVPRRLGRSVWINHLGIGVGGLLLLTGSLIVFRPLVCVAADAPSMRTTLRGVQGVQVVVEAMDPDAARHGLDRMQLQATIESWLRQGNIRVWPREGGGNRCNARPST